MTGSDCQYFYGVNDYRFNLKTYRINKNTINSVLPLSKYFTALKGI